MNTADYALASAPPADFMNPSNTDVPNSYVPPVGYPRQPTLDGDYPPPPPPQYVVPTYPHPQGPYATPHPSIESSSALPANNTSVTMSYQGSGGSGGSYDASSTVGMSYYTSGGQKKSSSSLLPTSTSTIHSTSSSSSSSYVSDASTPVLPSKTGIRLSMAEAGGFSDMLGAIKPVPAAVVTENKAGVRLGDLKRKFNELQKKRESYHTRQAANGGVAAGAAVFTLGVSLLVNGPAAVHQRNRLQQIVRAMRECLVQINSLREAFKDTPNWDTAEDAACINEKAFSKAIKRHELKGPL